MAATPKSEEGAYWTHGARKEFESFYQTCFDQHAFYVGYSVTNVFYCTIMVVEGVWGLAP